MGCELSKWWQKECIFKQNQIASRGSDYVELKDGCVFTGRYSITTEHNEIHFEEGTLTQKDGSQLMGKITDGFFEATSFIVKTPNGLFINLIDRSDITPSKIKLRVNISADYKSTDVAYFVNCFKNPPVIQPDQKTCKLIFEGEADVKVDEDKMRIDIRKGEIIIPDSLYIEGQAKDNYPTGEFVIYDLTVGKKYAAEFKQGVLIGELVDISKKAK